MGSGNSVPVQKASTVETEAHQDVFELRLDHLAVGTTALLFIILLFLIYLCRQRRKARRRAADKNWPTVHYSTNPPTVCCNHAPQWVNMSPMMPMPTMREQRFIHMMPQYAAPTTSYEEPLITEIYEEPPHRPQKQGGATAPPRPPLPEPVARLAASNNKPPERN